jgi:hypothetical protein
MPDNNPGNQSKSNSYPVVENPTCPAMEEKDLDWFSAWLRYQAQNQTLLKYIEMEVENGRQ